MATIDVKDAAGQIVAIEKPLVPGRAAAAESRPVVLSTEDLAALADIVAAIEAIPAAGDASAANQETEIAGLAAILAKLSADPATQTTLAAILAKMIAAPATEAKQDTLIAKDFATQTTLAALLAKVIAAPATEAKQDTMIARAVAQLGARTVAQSPAVNIATDDPQIGTKVTAVAALGAGGAGLIGWLSQIWDKLNAGVSGAVASGAADSGNPVKIGGVVDDTTPTAASDGQIKNIWVTPHGALMVGAQAFTGARAASNTLGAAMTPASANPRLTATAPFKFNGASWDPDSKPISISRILSAAASTNATLAKASPGEVFKIIGKNEAVALRYLKLYNKASAPTVGTDVPVLTIPLPASAAFDLDLGGHYFSTGIAYALTTGVADADTGSLTAADVLGLNISYA